MMEVLTKQKYGCYLNDTNVVMVIGDKQCTMTYEVAFELSAFLRHVATQAKMNAGDKSIRLTGIATLTDANADEMKAQLRRDATAVFVGRKPD